MENFEKELEKMYWININTLKILIDLNNDCKKQWKDISDVVEGWLYYLDVDNEYHND